MSMLDDLRKEAASSYGEAVPEQEEEGEESSNTASTAQDYYTPGMGQEMPRQERTILGMTAPQRFVLALILFMMTCVLGAFCLILTERVVLPF